MRVGAAARAAAVRATCRLRCKRMRYGRVTCSHVHVKGIQTRLDTARPGVSIYRAGARVPDLCGRAWAHAVQVACAKELKLFCKDVPHGEARAIRCLQVRLVPVLLAPVCNGFRPSRAVFHLLTDCEARMRHRSASCAKLPTLPLRPRPRIRRTTRGTRTLAGTVRRRSSPMSTSPPPTTASTTASARRAATTSRRCAPACAPPRTAR